ncbi:RND family efflux transporter MFP subunit [Myxococcus stipitatus DSM 14675]|uniref:RND family efflux transporter MFP subunit n=1 Tax=Myxococcus stipitatus (strain DSM 14675 / JCM 12634 / Mx s8) TaxID=1278073 RepID=L7UBU5_MYXSD|nr:efflux RND transporter periplasmic adaptor subunit [Myxococcus stipitatus]AGC45057.1 RND family efflux transporter MFP subunit [Myxococcus stipitatus DSM 14675]
MSKAKKWVITGVAAVLLGAGVYVTQRESQPKTAERSAALATVERRDMEVVAESAGLVEPLRVVEVKSKASGEVLRVLFDTGDKVEKDALLAEIDPRDVQNALAQAQADLESARVRLNTTEAQRQRMESLRQSGYVTQQEFESSVDAFATARAAKVRAETNLQLAKERSRDVTIRAPSSGTLLERQIQPGQIIASATSNVSGGSTLFKMADLSIMQVRAKVDETDVGQIRSGLKARVTMEAYPGRTFIGEVVKIEPQALVEQNVTLFPVLVRLDNPDGLLRPGMNAEVAIEISSRRDAITVPNSAVVGMRDARAAAVAVGLTEDAVRALLRPQGAKGEGRGRGGPGGNGPSENTATPTSGEATAGHPENKGPSLAPSASGGPQGATVATGTDSQGKNVVAAAGTPGGAGEGRRQRGGRQGTDGTRPGLVFVQGKAGPEPRKVVLGLSDWENSEVLSGLEPGEQVLLVSVAQLQQQQQRQNERFRQATGGMFPGAGGGGGGMRGGR